KLWLLSKENGLQCGVTEDMILSHRMDGLFSRNDIRFDYAHGVYYPKVDSNRCIIVEANDEVLLHWTTTVSTMRLPHLHPRCQPTLLDSPR
ncbi:UNVERIFIED_CONTAM: ABC transporter ATP-binding protein, partial [Bacteroidetes bacterium 56_B9]